VRKSIDVIDDFYATPDAVRGRALTKGDWVSAEVAERFAEIVGGPIEFDPARMEFASDERNAEVEFGAHCDDAEWVAVVCLTLDERGSGGLSLLRHRETGLPGPPTDADLDRLNLTTEEFELDVYHVDKLRPEAWEETTRVAMRYNRAIVVHGSRLFHRIQLGLDDAAGGGLLVQRFFFNSVKEAA
jgi:hypothetical protein